MQFSETLLQWYATHRRELPWRGISDPYRIWVSEIILQQTRIVQGYAYYHRFLAAFPTVEALAEAKEDEVLRLWQGLGYYSRARNLHAAARQVVEMGGFPKKYEEVRSLKGVGDYTAAAICSFAYGLPCAAVDGNVYRVMSRFFGIREPIDTGRGKKLFKELASELLPPTHAADYNQALMDFGAMQCVPSAPNCEDCPLEAACVARAEGRVGNFPVKSRRQKVVERFLIYIGVQTPAGFWLHHRAGGDIWQGLYEFPLIEAGHSLTQKELLNTQFLKSLPQGGVWSVVRLGVKHVLTHRVLRADFYSLAYDFSVQPPDGFIAVSREQLEDYAMPRLLTKILPLMLREGECPV